MKIDYKAPRVFITDVSLLFETVDSDSMLSPLAWQYCIENDLTEKAGLDVLRSISLEPALVSQIATIVFLQEHQKFNVINCLPGQLILYLRSFKVEIKINGCAMLLIAA